MSQAFRELVTGRAGGAAVAAIALALLAAATPGHAQMLVRRVGIAFPAGSAQLPAEARAAIRSMLDDAARECLQPALAAVAVEEVRQLPLGRVSSGATARTQQVAAAVRSASTDAITPYEASLSPDSERARRIGLKADQVLVELTCRPKEP